MSKDKQYFLDYLRKHYVDSLRIAMSQLRKTADDCLKKIDEQGIAGYYSGNNDVHRYASNAWRCSLALCELKRFEEQIQSTIESGIDDALQEMLDSRKQSLTEE